MVSHGGDHVTGFTASFSRFVDDKLAVIVLTNMMRFDIRTLVRRVGGFYNPALVPTEAATP